MPIPNGEEKTEKYRNFLRNIVRLESPTEDKTAVDAVCTCIAGFCKEQGYRVARHPFDRAGDCLTATANPGGAGAPVLFLAHMDTVHQKGRFGENTVWEENGRLHGPGVYDCKGGIAVALFAIEQLLDAGYTARPLCLLLTGDEENNRFSGRAGARFIIETARGCCAAINCEGRVANQVTVARKGSVRAEIEIEGRSAHSGTNYADGISAVREAAHKIIELEAGSDPEDITYNCGIIRGGTAANIVPAHCSLTVDSRYIYLRDRTRAFSHIRRIAETSYIGTESTFTVTNQRPPMERCRENLALFNHIRGVWSRHGFGEVEAVLKGGGSDSAYTELAGVPSVCSMGILGSGAHTTEEYAQIDTMEQAARSLALTVLELPEDFGTAG